MEKYFTVKMNSANAGNFMISCNDIKGIEQNSTTVVRIFYGNARSIDIEHSAVASGNVEPRSLINSAVEEALSTDWREVDRVVDCSFVAASGAQAVWLSVGQN
tara:strand:- start:3981 stop:4289 length:309 start_codon:yes stop_codon:yes gene_type:complete